MCTMPASRKAPLSTDFQSIYLSYYRPPFRRWNTIREEYTEIKYTKAGQRDREEGRNSERRDSAMSLDRSVVLCRKNCQPRPEKSFRDLWVRQDPDDDFWLDSSGYGT